MLRSPAADGSEQRRLRLGGERLQPAPGVLFLTGAHMTIATKPYLSCQIWLSRSRPTTIPQVSLCSQPASRPRRDIPRICHTHDISIQKHDAPCKRAGKELKRLEGAAVGDVLFGRWKSLRGTDLRRRPRSGAVAVVSARTSSVRVLCPELIRARPRNEQTPAGDVSPHSPSASAKSSSPRSLSLPLHLSSDHASSTSSSARRAYIFPHHG